MLNQVQLIGHVGADPDIRSSQGGDDIANFRMATPEKWKDRTTGEKRERTEWHTVVVFGPLAGVVKNYVKKGSKLFVQGALRTRKWQDQQGQDRYSTEVVLSGFDAKLSLLDSAQGGGSRDYSSYQDGPGNSGGGTVGGGAAGGGSGGSFADDLDDDVPF